MTVDATGITIPTIEDLLEELAINFRAEVDPNMNVEPDAMMGRFIGIISDLARRAWEDVQASYNATDPDFAEGRALDAVCAITGVKRKAATYSTVTATFNVDAGATIPIGAVAHVAGDPSNRWVSQEIADNSAGGAPANIDVLMQASTTGEKVAVAGTLTEIATPITGWISVTNAADASVGREDETDAELRLRREAELLLAGGGSLDAILAAVREVEGVINASGYENDTLIIDPETGVPPKAFEIILWDDIAPQADDDEIAQAIWENKPAGIKSIGNTSGNADDLDGVAHVVPFTRPTVKEVYLEITLTYSSLAEYIGDAAIKTTIASYFSGTTKFLRPGIDVVPSRVSGVVALQAGVQSVDVVLLGFVASPSLGLTLSIGPREVAHIDSANITINSSLAVSI